MEGLSSAGGPGDVKLTPQKRKFVLNLIEQDFERAYVAYMRASPKCKSEHAARVYTARLMKDPAVAAEVSRVLADMMAERKIPVEKRVFDVWFKRAFYDVTEIIGLDGRVRLTEEELRERGLQVCIDGVVQKRTPQGESYVEVKFADRQQALEMLATYVRMIRKGEGGFGDLPPGSQVHVYVPSNGREFK